MLTLQKNARILLATLLLAVFQTACTSAGSTGGFISAEPEQGAVLSSAPRQLRLYYVELPDVPSSTVILEGPDGEVNLRGLHTMGANDLMMEIFDEVPNGRYTVKWSTVLGDDPTQLQGQYEFTVQAN
jgi:methionine-rich copper-binding protein CopC